LSLSSLESKDADNHELFRVKSPPRSGPNGFELAGGHLVETTRKRGSASKWLLRVCPWGLKAMWWFEDGMDGSMGAHDHVGSGSRDVWMELELVYHNRQISKFFLHSPAK
jgi:hypothetical protein